MERNESGFTLTELLVVLVIMPLIIGAIVAVVVTGLLNQNQASTPLADSTSANITTAFFVRDVESSQFVTTDATLATTANTTPPCGYNPTMTELLRPVRRAARLGTGRRSPYLGHSDLRGWV